MNWHPIELHTHTHHSDGDFTVTELVRAAKEKGFSAIACTDHNSVSGLTELDIEAEKENMVPIHGIEWTTYWGHMLVLGEQGYTDWRGVQPEEIDAAIASIHKNNGIVGVAHPFALGNPVNTGYQWRFQISDWRKVDFLEVWSRNNAPIKVQSYRAFALWDDLLNQGIHITATSGRDWHRTDSFIYVHTYVGVNEELSEKRIFDAIRNGRVCITAGPLLTMHSVNADGIKAEIGDTYPAGNWKICLRTYNQTMQNDWDKHEVLPKEIRIVHNGEVIAHSAAENPQDICVDVSSGWLRAELIGTYYGRQNQRLAFTNAIYFE